MRERSELISWLRGDIVGPSIALVDPTVVTFQGNVLIEERPRRQGAVFWRPDPGEDLQEVLYFDGETPHRKYGTGLLHPAGLPEAPSVTPDQAAAEATDTIGADFDETEAPSGGLSSGVEDQPREDLSDTESADDFEVTSADIRHPSSIGISFCARLDTNGKLVVRLPQSRRFPWQQGESSPCQLNGRYERCVRRWVDAEGHSKEAPAWRRRTALFPDTEIVVERSALNSGRAVREAVVAPNGSPIVLSLEIFPRRLRHEQDVWLLTVVLRNVTRTASASVPREATLYQTYFEVSVANGSLEKYPESQRPFEHLDAEEQSLALLYRESATWGIGHGCAAGWDAGPGEDPLTLYADVMPAVEVPSMTPDITDRAGAPMRHSMRALAALSDDGLGAGWESLRGLAAEYESWIQRRRADLASLPEKLQPVGRRHLDACDRCLARVSSGVELLRRDGRVRTAFRLANLTMLLQQIATKQLPRRQLVWDGGARVVRPHGSHQSPWMVFEENAEGQNVGWWRAFQIAFLLMSLEGMASDASPDREVVDLIWFPTGGGKTEAYLGVMAFYMFHERLLDGSTEGENRDGTNVLMRYTLRMLTTQQFQRAASLVCAMEFLRRNPRATGSRVVSGGRFSLGLWIGGTGSPNKIVGARADLGAFRRGNIPGNPLILTECPWCRAAIGRYDGTKPSITPRLTETQWNALRTRGITDHDTEGPLLHCTDTQCAFGRERWEDWLPVEVIDERIYRHPPSVVIATADKLAMIAYRPDAGALFGRRVVANEPIATHRPPGLIIQDELHLISGPLGTMYALYEGIFERLCSLQREAGWIKPKLIASTATIRGADDQVRSLYSRTHTQLFPSPGLLMGDSFFGTYARRDNGSLLEGRLYLGLHANDYGSILTTQVRAFSSALFRPALFAPEHRDPWWTLLAFYNSIRELGGAKTLFDSDIISRLKFMFNREGITVGERRNLKIVEELTSRLSQSEIVGMMDRMSTGYTATGNEALDACLASNIIEVGVDIDRLSLMGVVGQPKTTAQYIQVTGRVGRRWWERPGLILMIYNPSKSRDRSHFEQFHSYHRRLYERVEPTSATPFALSAIQRALPGALLAWARQFSRAPVRSFAAYKSEVRVACELLRDRCAAVQTPEDMQRSLDELERVRDELFAKWDRNPQEWEEFPPNVQGEYLMLWPGQFATRLQKDRGVVVPSSMRQVDGSAELTITQGYALGND